MKIPLVVFFCIILGTSSVECVEYFVRRGFLQQNNPDVLALQDVFSYTVDSSVESCFPCSNFGAYPISLNEGQSPSLCSCRCGYWSSTFIPEFEGCVFNKNARAWFGGCVKLFQGESAEPLFVLDVINTSSQVLKTLKAENCQIANNGQHYYKNKCWQATSNISFSINYYHQWKLKLDWTSTSQNDTKGRIFKLDLSSCSKQQQWAHKACILFKAKGSFRYKTSTATSSCPTLTPITSKPSSPNSQLATSTSTAPLKSTSPSKLTKTERQTEEQSFPVGAIVGSVIAAIVVGVIVLLIFMWRRCKKTPGQTNKDNPTYGKNETINLSKQSQRTADSEFEYDYAAVDGDPRSSSSAAPGIYQSLTKDPNQESDQQQGNPSDQSSGYDKVQHPVFQPPRKGPTDPLYNVLERPNGNSYDYMEPGVNIDKAPQNNEPVYNVLEGPGEDPDYNVLEDPDEQYEPEYNVLERPGNNPDNVPVDGHDNVGYASTIDIKSGGAPNGPIYAAPEGPISEPTYQPLNVNGPGENVYQPLDRKSRVVPGDQPLYHVLESTTSDA